MKSLEIKFWIRRGSTYTIPKYTKLNSINAITITKDFRFILVLGFNISISCRYDNAAKNRNEDVEYENNFNRKIYHSRVNNSVE